MPPLSLGQGVSHEWRIPRLQQRVECETQGPFCGVTFMYSVDGKVNFPIHMWCMTSPLIVGWPWHTAQVSVHGCKGFQRCLDWLAGLWVWATQSAVLVCFRDLVMFGVVLYCFISSFRSKSWHFVLDPMAQHESLRTFVFGFLQDVFIAQKWGICHCIGKNLVFPMCSQDSPMTSTSLHLAIRLEGLGPFVLRFYPRGVESSSVSRLSREEMSCEA